MNIPKQLYDLFYHGVGPATEEGRLERLVDDVPYDERICRHGLRFDVHCRECSIAGYCGCSGCTETA